MDSKKSLKDKIGEAIGAILFFVIIFAFIYYKFIYTPEPYKPMSAYEERESEKRIIDEYGSMENFDNELEYYESHQNEPEWSSAGHPTWNN